MRRALGIIPTLLFATLGLAAQPDRITGPINTYDTVVLQGGVHPKAQPQFDQGPVEASFKLANVTMVIPPSAKQQADLEQLLKQQQDPSSRNYRKWLTPEQYADRFGLSRNDVEKLTGWLQSQGFSIVQVARGRNWIAFSGTAAQVENIFHTEIHYFDVDGERHVANATEVWIPQALSGIVIGFRGLNDFGPKPMGIREPGLTEFFPMIARPFYTATTGLHFLAPDDIATIYDITPLYNAGINGTGMKMVVVGQTDINTTDIDQFRTGFNLPAINLTQMLVTGSTDPGTTSDLGEADLDLEWSGAVARNANIIYVKATTANNFGGVFASAQYAIDNDLAPVISMSYGGCESDNVSFIPFNEPEQQKANTEGITFLSSSGDEGAAACDSDTEKVATGGLAVNYPASSPEVTGVGGNEFNEAGGNYWNGSNSTNGESAISYIPEMAWNDTPLGFGLAASGGGASSCGQSTGNTCTGGFTKPTWQTGTGVPSDGVRDVPDVSMAASADHDGYIFCTSGSCAGGIASAVQSNSIVGGTSASAPVFAGIVTLLNQFVGGGGLGNINTRLYQLAQNASNGVFHDVTTGNNIVPCTPGTPTGFPTALQCPSSGSFGYKAGVGYDQVTGLGSVDANALATDFSGSPTTTTVSSSLNPAAAGASVTFTATVAGNASHAPTGTVTFSDGTTQLGTATLASGSAVFATTSLSVGPHSITATYEGDGFNAQSKSSALSETINAATGAATTTTLSPSVNPASFGSAVTFTATVKTAGLNAPTGTVAFNDSSTPLGTGTVNGTGVATLTTSTLGAGSHNIVAVYQGDTNNAPSSSPALVETIHGTTTTSLTSSASTLFSGASVTLTATVTGSAGAGPTGTVTFNDGSTPLPGSPVTLNSSGVATLPASLTAPGAHSITAVYSGDSNYSGSTSSATTVTVNAATFTFAASPASDTVTAGTNASYTLTVTPSGSYTSQISFSCAFSPSSSATCAVSPAINPPVTSATMTTLTISGAQAAAAMMRAANTRPQRVPPLYAFWMPMGVAGLFLLGGGKKSKAQALKLLLLVGALLLVAVTMFGCGGGSSTPTPPTQQPQTYQVTITATAPATANGSSAAVSTTQTVSLTVNP